jgi:hypothetical protein
VREIGKTLVHIFDLEADLFDIEPRLTFDQLRPSLDPIDLNTSLERLLSENRDIYESTIQEFKTHMLDKIASRFETACEAGTEYEFAQRWWDEQQKPFSPVVKVYRLLKHERRFMRYQGAKVLEERFGVPIWDSKQGDVSLEIAEQWFNNWLV